MKQTCRRPKDPYCPRCGKRTLALANAGPDWAEEPAGLWAYDYDCVQCDGHRTEYGTPPNEAPE
jgi:hypothetical protein